MQHYRFLKSTSSQQVAGVLHFISGKFSGLICCLICGLLCGVNTAIAGTDKIRIITDIAPVHSLVSMVVGQHADVELLVPPSQSPHSFSLKPSQIRSLNQASMIVILSNDFTPTLSRHLISIDQTSIVLQLSDANGEHHNDQHSDFKHANNHQESNDRSNGQKVARGAGDNVVLTHAPTEHVEDVHTWLNPENAIMWIDRIAHTAIQLDEENSAAYTRNASSAKTELVQMHNKFANQLSAVRSANYIVYHDAYQHFAQSYGLQKPIAIALSDARAPGARKLRAMRSEAKQTKCVFSELLHDDIIVDTVTAGLKVNRAILDPIGSTVPIGPKHYPQMMQALVNSFATCLH